MQLSVIIPTRNRADTLARCLDSLKRQTLSTKSFEVLVIDNGSTDHTADVAATYAASLPLVYAHKDEPGLHVGRHEGLRLSRSDGLVFADDDIRAEPTWLQAIATAFADPSVAMVGGNNYPDFECKPPLWLEQLWERPVYKGRALPALSVLDFGSGSFEIDPTYVWGCNFSIRKTILQQAGGFHPDGVPPERLRLRGDGETHVSNYVSAAGLKTMFDSGASVYHLVSSDRMTIRYLCRRYYAQGVSDSYTAIRAARERPGYASRLRRHLNVVKTRAMNTLRSHFSDPTDRALLAARQAYAEGYLFHTKQVTADPSLLAWVTRASYL